MFPTAGLCQAGFSEGLTVKTNRAASRGFALVLALAMLVLVAGLITAYFSRALQESRVSSASTAGETTDLMAEAVTWLILDDLFEEMVAGSEPWDDEAPFPIFRPILLDPIHGETVPVAPSMAPQRVDSDLQNLPTVIKTSRHNIPFFAGGAGYNPAASPGPARASSVNTTAPSLTGHFLPREMWNLPRLMSAQEFLPPGGADDPGFRSPDWIYLNREGESPIPSTGSLQDLANADPENQAYVIGRFSYVIYDVGGLLDINVVGNALGTDANRHRGYLHQIDLSNGIAGIGAGGMEEFGDFVSGWRWPDWSGDEEMLFDPTRDFLIVEPGSQSFVNRQELLAYVGGGQFGISEDALPFLTVHSRSVNAPHWRPDPDYWEDHSPDPNPEGLNPDLMLVRFPVETELERGDDPPLTVPAGTPVMSRRFPLTKLDYFNTWDSERYANPSADSLRYYFGVEGVANEPATYRYVETVDTGEGPRIARLDEVAEMGREPNFFEILRAVILTGSLGRSAGHSYTLDMLHDGSGDLQTLQIGANIIDQWDSDDVPTTIYFPSGEADPWNAPIALHGIENLPYVYQMRYVPHRPEYLDERDWLQLWMVFNVWNPHQNAAGPPSDAQPPQTSATVERIRIVPAPAITTEDGEPLLRDFTMLGTTYMHDPSFGLMGSYRPHAGELDIAELNAGRSLEFPAFPGAGGYSNITDVGGEPPLTETDAPGILLWERNLSEGELSEGQLGPRPNPAIPPRGADRSSDLQAGLNEVMDAVAPYTATHPDPGDPRFEDANHNGDREYKAGTQFSLSPEFYAVEGVSESDWDFEDFWEANLEGDRIAVYARYPTKAHNRLRHVIPTNYSNPSHFEGNEYNPLWVPPVGLPLDFMVQAGVRVAGQTELEWKTYQDIEGFFRRRMGSGGKGISRNVPDVAIGRNLNYFATDPTHHSEVGDTVIEGWPANRSFYSWLPSNQYTRFDPRGRRFGFNEAMGQAWGHSVRSSVHPWTGDHSDPHLWVSFRDGIPMTGYYPSPTEAGFEYLPQNLIPGGRSNHYYAAGGLITNDPEQEALNSIHTMRYAGRDGIIRPADGYFGDGLDVIPTVPDRFMDRQVVLNRPFRSPADLGYVFRDEPWKTLDFASRFSADLGLLDVFSLEETTNEVPLVAGKVNLNTQREEVLEVLLSGTLSRFGDIHEDVETDLLEPNLAGELAQRIITESRGSPFTYASDLIPRVFHPEGSDKALLADIPEGSGGRIVRKPEREAAIRTLAGLGQSCTWNLMIDVVVQAGRYTAASQDPADFLVQGERRYWIHLAMDRLTGEVVDIQKERVER